MSVFMVHILYIDLWEQYGILSPLCKHDSIYSKRIMDTFSKTKPISLASDVPNEIWHDCQDWWNLQTKSKYKMRRHQNRWQPPLQPKFLVQFDWFRHCWKAHGNRIWVTIGISKFPFLPWNIHIIRSIYCSFV